MPLMIKTSKFYKNRNLVIKIKAIFRIIVYQRGVYCVVGLDRYLPEYAERDVYDSGLLVGR